MLYKILVSLSLVFLSVSSSSANEVVKEVSNTAANEVNKGVPDASKKEVDKLVGTYSAAYYGERSDRYRIEKHESSFRLFENTASVWKEVHKKTPAKSINKKQFEKMMKQTVSGPAFGLNFSDRVVIFKVKKDFTIGKQKMTTGHFVFFDGVFMELKKEK